MATRTFDIGALISAHSHILVTKMEDVYQVFNHLTQDSLYTHQLIVAGLVMRSEISRQLPFMEEIKIPEGLNTKDLCDKFVGQTADRYGAEHALESAEHLWVGHDFATDLNDIMEGKYRG